MKKLYIKYFISLDDDINTQTKSYVRHSYICYTIRKIWFYINLR